MGTKVGQRYKYPMIQNKVHSLASSLPKSFDSREHWAHLNCNSTIPQIFNQAKCGSCWAFGAIESIQDRLCIASNGTTDIELSFMDLVTCDQNDMGCEGGDPYSAQLWVQQNGVVSNSCSPYTIPTCPPEQQPCLSFVPTPNCVTSCSNGDSWNPKQVTTNVYGISQDADQIAREIMTNGPVEAAFTVYADFPSYKNGVYKHVSGNALGGHAINIIGWV